MAAAAMEDPLGAASFAAGSSSAAAAPAAAASASSRLGPGLSVTAHHSPYLDWPSRKAAVLREFTVTGDIAVSASFLTEGGAEDAGEETSVPLAKARQRLENLEAAAKGLATVEMSQAEYVRRIERLHRGLKHAWDNNQRVSALKICIQCAKLLGEPRVPQFYPSMFVMVTEILDTFGASVYERLKSLADEESKKLGGVAALPDDFLSTDVGGEARETCRNWMYKCACIRELLPRVYVEMALLACYRFIYDADYAAILLRLAHSIRGIGNPLVAVYARWYLARMAARLVRDDNKQRESVYACVRDYLFTFNEIAGGVREKQLESMGVTMSVYLNLHAPAIGWQIHQLGWGASREVFTGVLTAYRDHCGSSMVLKHIIDAFDARYWVPHLQSMLTLSKDAKLSLITGADLFRSMCASMATHEVAPVPELQLPFLNEAWNAFRREKDIIAYTKNSAALVDMLLATYTEREVLILLTDLVKRLNATGDGSGPVEAPPAALPHMEHILTSIVVAEVKRLDGAGRFSSVITSDAFTAMLDMFAHEHKHTLCMSLLTALTRVNGRITDPVVVNTMLEVARVCADACDVLSTSDQLRTTTHIISSFIDKIDFGRDLERTLEVYVQARSSFHNLDGVTQRLVRAAIALAERAHAFVKGKHSAKTAAFVKSVCAYVSITIPVCEDAHTRMDMYIAAGSAALLNLCSAQADALFRAFVSEIPELPPASTELDMRVVDLIARFTRAVVPAPGHPDHGPFYLARGLVAALGRYTWTTPFESATRARAYVCVCALLAAYARMGDAGEQLQQEQREYPGAYPFTPIPGLDSNDVLYAGDATYTSDLQTLLRTCCDTLFTQLCEMRDAAATNPRCKTAVIDSCAAVLQRSAELCDADAGVASSLKGIRDILHAVAPSHEVLSAATAALQGLQPQNPSA